MEQLLEYVNDLSGTGAVIVVIWLFLKHETKRDEMFKEEITHLRHAIQELTKGFEK